MTPAISLHWMYFLRLEAAGVERKRESFAAVSRT
jgi:hypothetical protein